MVARLDFGVSATGMGDSTTKITWAVSLLTLLRLVYIAYKPQILQSPILDVQTSKQNAKQNLRKMVGYIEPSLIGNGTQQVILDDEWYVIEATCTANVKNISNQELDAMKIFGVAGSLRLHLRPVENHLAWDATAAWRLKACSMDPQASD
ncbi:MAG: hypothetical protein Q9188_003578 [Gyalolechia gomerana]